MEKDVTSQIKKTKERIDRIDARGAVKFVDSGNTKFDMFGKEGCLGYPYARRMDLKTCTTCKNLDILNTRCLIFGPLHRV